VSAREHAATAAEAIRQLARETIWAEAYASPVDFDETILELAVLAQRLAQALRHSSEWLVEAQGQGAVAHDTHGAAGATVVKISLHLAQAAATAKALAHDLDAARELTARLHTPGYVDYATPRAADQAPGDPS
jgi:hypothetical protein